ncbi:MAG: hypothetical protein EBX40_08885, partial [Gammaproteobacteria bacterium]|nr:hypothetical protein [Gammaproteobacteria bacterium]
MTLTLVYTGPSLHPSEAQSIFKDAHIFNPIRCGDLIKAMRLNPNRVVIIDGYFEQTGSIWHKEILYALSRGVRVYGSSSMGALRAAELAPFGMQGYGKIYETYASGALIDDDEVSLVHDSDFKTRVPALINVRFTLEKAIKLGEISPDEAEKIITDLKALPYY